MKKIFPIALIFCLVGLLVWGCGSGGGNSSAGSTTAGGTTGGTTVGGATPTPTPATATVNVAANASNPTGFAFAGPITVKSGTSVTWVNTTSAPHSIVWDSHTPSTSPAPGADIGTFTGGSTSTPWIAPTVTVSTTYAYHCGIHGPQMAGQIIVTP